MNAHRCAAGEERKLTRRRADVRSAEPRIRLMVTSLSSKLGMKEERRSGLIGAPSEIVETLSAGAVRLSKSLTGSFDHIHAFFKSQEKLKSRFPRLKKHLRKGGALWISWPKAKKLETDLNLKVIIAIGYRHGLVESKTIGVDSNWSAIKFTFPKKGKVYNNSYGRLPEAN